MPDAGAAAAHEPRIPPREAATAPPGWGWPDALVALGVALNLAVYAALDGMPWQDAANHAARYALIARAWFRVPAPWVRVVPLPAPYLGLDAVAAVLAAVVGPAWAAHLVGAAALSAPAVGLWLLLRRTAPALRAGALAGVLLGFSFYFLNGLLNYVLGVGAALAWVAAWWPYRARCSAGRRAALALGAGALYSLHLSAVCAALAVAGAELLGAAAADARAAHAAGRPLAFGSLLRAHLGRLATVAAAAAVVGALWLALTLALPPAPGVAAGSAPIFRSWPSKAWTLTMPFYTFGPWEMMATLPAYAAGLAGVLRAGWRGRAARAPQGDAQHGDPPRDAPWRSPTALAVVGLAALYLVTPMATTAGYSLLDVRWLLPAALLAFAAVPATATRAKLAPAPRWAIAALAAGCVAHVAVVLGAGRATARELADYDAVLAALPPTARLTAVVAGPQRWARVDPRLHHALLQTVRTGARVGGLFAYEYRPAGRPPAAYFHFAHFREPAPGWFLDERWEEVGRPAIPWARVAREYDVVVLAGESPGALAAVRAGGGCLVARRGSVSAWTARPCGAGASLAR